MADAILDRKPGDEVEIEYFRGDERKTVEVELGKRPQSLDAGALAAGRRGAARRRPAFPAAVGVVPPLVA